MSVPDNLGRGAAVQNDQRAEFLTQSLLAQPSRHPCSELTTILQKLGEVSAALLPG